MTRLVITEIARADLDSIRRYSTRTWGEERTKAYLNALRDTLKGLLRGTVAARGRDDLRLGIQMAISGRHGIFFEANESHLIIGRPGDEA